MACIKKMLHLSFLRSNLEDAKQPVEAYLRPTSYKDAIRAETTTSIAPLRTDHGDGRCNNEEEEEFQNDVFADYCDRDYVEFYTEFEQYLLENGLMSLGKSYEVLNIIYDCIDVVENATDSCDESDEDWENEDCIDYYC